MRGERIDAISVWGMLRGKDFRIPQGHAVGVVEGHLPGGGIPDGDSLDHNMFAVVEEEEPRTLRRYIVGRVFVGVYLSPPGLTSAVDDAVAADGDILGIGSADQWLYRVL